MMTTYFRLTTLIYLMFFILTSADATSLNWICTATDNYYQEWKIENISQQIAINQALDTCKTQSKEPQSCKVSKENCESFMNGKSTRPRWRCIAMDDQAQKWVSNEYVNRDDAAIAALDYCKQKSSSAHSCYIHLLTCKNMNRQK